MIFHWAFHKLWSRSKAWRRSMLSVSPSCTSSRSINWKIHHLSSKNSNLWNHSCKASYSKKIKTTNQARQRSQSNPCLRRCQSSKISPNCISQVLKTFKLKWRVMGTDSKPRPKPIRLKHRMWVRNKITILFPRQATMTTSNLKTNLKALKKADTLASRIVHRTANLILRRPLAEIQVTRRARNNGTLLSEPSRQSLSTPKANQKCTNCSLRPHKT